MVTNIHSPKIGIRSTSPSAEPFDREQLLEVLDVSERTALKWGADEFEAQEVAQVTVIKLMDPKRRAKVRDAQARPGEGWRNFISAVAKNVHLDHVRSQDRRVQRERRAQSVTGAPLHDRPAVHRPAPPVDLSGQEEYLSRLAVVEAIETLNSKRQRECMMLIHVDGLSIKEVSDKLRLRQQTVRGHVRDARKILRLQFSD